MCVAEHTLQREQLPQQSLLRYSDEQLKKYISKAKCAELRTSINNSAIIHLPNKQIKEELEEIEQFYKELTMVNQFSGQPLVMPLPHKCISLLTYRLAISLSKKKRSNVIQTVFKQNELLIRLTEEIETFLT
ncbi:unnamed protein product [Rotaria sp. Silwood1]|nr:unnamed protein product [Rotaria sp. Silwood1]